MSKYRITKFDVTESVDTMPTISMDIVARGYLTSEDLNDLRRIIEQEPYDIHIFGGRGNGKTKYFSDWCRVAFSETTDIRFEIKRVILHDPATIVFWEDGTKTVVKCQDGDTYSPEVGIAMCYMKKALGNKSNFNNTFKKHVPAALVAQTLSKENLDAAKKALEKEDKPTTRTYSHLDTEAIYRILRVNKWTVKEFAQVVGVDHSSVYHWLKGGGIKKRNISKMVKALHVPEEAIIKEDK